MTALVGVLNKRGAAIAADSAMTVSGNGNTKIYNNEQKIFPLSDKNPIGLMICNNLDFLTTPWALIFELYKAERGDKKFPSLTGFVEDFIEFLSSMKSLQSKEEKAVHYRNDFNILLEAVRSIYSDKCDEELDNELVFPGDELSRKCYTYAFDTLREVIYEDEVLPLLKTFSLVEFYEEIIEPNLEYFEEERKQFPRMKDEEWDLLLKYFHRHLINDDFNPVLSTEIIFVGYGEEDIFPASQRLYISGMVGDKIKYKIEEISEITHTLSAEIRPFAQTDVMLTLMQGVSPQLDMEYREATSELEESVMDDIISILQKEKVSQKTIQKVCEVSLDKIHEHYMERINNFVHENYTGGVVNALNFFNLEEMAKMAENLIAVTNLQRHISSSEESVGGPIEVAIITKTGGFKWVKHNILE